MLLLDTAALPQSFSDAAALDAFLALPTPALLADLAGLDGDLAVLGVGGKMGPSLALLARAALPGRRVIGVARFTEPGLRARLESAGVETLFCDLLDAASVRALPRVANVVFMVGRKFGTTADASLTWAVNTLPVVHAAEHFSGCRMVVFSSGNVYPLSPVVRQGCRESDPPGPVGEYANSCLARERLFAFAAARFGVQGCILRLNYAVECRYGVLFDLARRIVAGEAIPLATGSVNLIWQGDANAAALRALRLAATPPMVLNVTGPETASVRVLAEELGARLGRAPVFAGEEAPEALLSNAGLAASRFGYPAVPLGCVLDWVADWVAREQPGLGKPTHFEVRDGRF
jgi:nucleoside-diphosphate-sugar epimerase